MAIRRLYVYIVSTVSLAMVLGGLGSLGSALIDLVFGGLVLGAGFRESVATAAAVTLIGTPVWAAHWNSAQRTALRDAAERASALRRLYLYAASAALAVASGLMGSQLLERLLRPLTEGSRVEPAGMGIAAWHLLLVAATLIYHVNVADRDRAAVGERGGSATLRRWYVYGVQFVALVTALFGVRELLYGLVAAPGSLAAFGGVSSELARTLAWTTIWALHVGLAERPPIAAEDRRSTLRAVQGFMLLALAVGFVLVDASRVLYFLLARALGVAAPGGVASFGLAVLARPLSTVVIFGSVWAFTRHRLRADAQDAEAPRQAGVRRFYAHLVALAALAAVAAGATGLLWALTDWALAAPGPTETWRDQISLSVTLVAVGLPVWLLHWRASPLLAARLALSRRLYLFTTFALSVLALLAGGAILVSVLLNGLLAGELALIPTRASRPLSAVLVAAAIGGYHWRMLRGETEERVSVEEAAAPAAETAAGQVLVFEVMGATEPQIREALAQLPSGASYRFRAEDAGLSSE